MIMTTMMMIMIMMIMRTIQRVGRGPGYKGFLMTMMILIIDKMNMIMTVLMMIMNMMILRTNTEIRNRTRR